MEVKTVSIFWKAFSNSKDSSSATILVEGIGDIRIDDVISQELREAIEKEVIVALKQKLGQII
jgi:hypothetical protein